MKITTALRRKLESYVASAQSKGTSLGWKKHLRSWPAYAAAGASSLAIVSSAGAGIISSGPLNVTDLPGQIDGDFNGKQVRIGSASFSELAQGYKNPNSADGFLQVNMYPNPSRGNLINLPYPYGLTPHRFSLGDVISANVAGYRGGFGSIVDKRIPANPYAFCLWPVNAPAFVGIELNQPDGVHFGWVKFKWAEDADGLPYSETILGWAYNDVAGASIRAGEVPEPGTMTMALLAAGSAGVLAWRRRRKEQAVGAEAVS